MSVSDRSLPNQTEADPSYRAFLFPMVVGAALLLFLAAPWSLEHKAHVALHGLCAQRPSHSFYFGEQRLPFDARMTGIYAGFAGAVAYLLLRGRHRRAGLPSIPAFSVLLLFIGAMAFDGFNSTFKDMDAPYLYEPDNRLRLVTGAMTGIGLAVAIVLLIGMVLWKRPDARSRVVDRVWEPFLMLALLVPLGLLIDSGWAPAYVPLTLLLLLSAVAVFGAMMTVVVVLFRYVDNTFERPSDLQSYATAGFLIGLVAIAAIGGGRFILEAVTNAPPLT
jgi:uncharacterized membrane protein